MYQKFCIIFPNFTPPTQGLFMFRPEWFYLFYIGRYPICFMQNISLIGWFWSRSRLNVFYHIWAWRPSWISNHNLFILILYNHQINAKYEISFKLAQYFHRKRHLNFVMNGCHGNQSCDAIFIKNFRYVIRTLFLIFLWKISFLALWVHVSEILHHFSQLYPTHSRLVYDPTGTILAIL